MGKCTRGLRLIRKVFPTWKENMAYDEVLMKRCETLALRIYPSLKKGVIIGRFQSINEETHYQRCVEDNIEVVRRISGGGSVFKVPYGEMNYSVVASPECFAAFKTVKGAYKVVLDVLKQAVNYVFNIQSEISPGSVDLVIEGRKISGNSQARKYNRVLVHGTLLLKIDKSEMFKYISMPQKKYQNRGFDTPYDFVTDIYTHSKREASIEEIIESITALFKKKLNVKVFEEDISLEEKNAVSLLVKNKYAQWLWTIDKKDPTRRGRNYEDSAVL